MASIKTKSGRVLTQKYLDELAAEAEAGYDLSKARRVYVGRGRPPLGNADGGESPRVTLRLPQDVYDAAQRKAAAQGTTISHLAREALKKDLRL